MAARWTEPGGDRSRERAASGASEISRRCCRRTPPEMPGLQVKTRGRVALLHWAQPRAWRNTQPDFPQGLIGLTK
jgi:hypothetical protein